jgi:hypothetical protein
LLRQEKALQLPRTPSLTKYKSNSVKTSIDCTHKPVGKIAALMPLRNGKLAQKVQEEQYKKDSPECVRSIASAGKPKSHCNYAGNLS